MGEIDLNCSYLVNAYNVLSLIKIIYISKTSYKIQHECGNCIWIEKEKFHDKYTVVEKISTYVPYFTTNTSNICPVCGGKGTVPSYGSDITSPEITCPACNGCKTYI